MPKRAVIALLIAFALTRGLSGWLAHHPDSYKGDTLVAGDVAIYHYYASLILDGDQAPYTDVDIEYPPGSLVLMTVPYVLSSDEDTYRLLFILEMIVIDALGAVALLILGRRWTYRWGVWAWVFLLPFLGPIVHLRLDLVPAVLTIWAFERATAGKWLESGAALGVGTAIKLYPIALLPILLVVTWKRRQLLIGAALPLVAVVLPYLSALPEVFDSVVGYQTERGLQVESTWGLLLMFASSLGYDASTIYNFGAFHVVSSASRFLDTLSTLVSAAVAVALPWLAFRRIERGDVRSAALVSYSLIALLLVVASVWSPQFLIWVIALACVALCSRGEELRYVAYVLAGAGVASQIAYPFTYIDLLEGNVFVTALLLVRNAAVAVTAALVLFSVFPTLRPGKKNAGQITEVSDSSSPDSSSDMAPPSTR